MCIADYIPFVYKRSGEGKYRMDMKAMLSQLIVAAIIGLVAMNAIQHDLMTELAAIKQDIAEVKNDVSVIRKDFYVPRN